MKWWLAKGDRHHRRGTCRTIVQPRKDYTGGIVRSTDFSPTQLQDFHWASDTKDMHRAKKNGERRWPLARVV